MTRNRLFPTMLALTFCFQPSAHADRPLKAGNSAPPLSFKQILQAPAGGRGTWEELKGQAVVLEFWATWCGGCVDNIPHLNELAAEFKSSLFRLLFGILARPFKSPLVRNENDVMGRFRDQDRIVFIAF